MPFITQGKSNIKYLLIVGLIAAVAGGIIFIYWSDYRKEIISLNKIIEIKKPEKKRILLTKDNIQSNWEACDYKLDYNSCFTFNNDLPSIEITYLNKEKGISLKIPFNNKWGNKKYEIPPYYEYEDRIEFGPLLSNIDNKWTRAFTLSFKPQLSAEKIVSSLSEGVVKTPGTFGIQKESIKEDKVSDKTVVRYSLNQGYATSDDVEAEITLSADVTEIIGKKYNYELVACSNKLGMQTWFIDYETRDSGMGGSPWESFCLDMVESIISNILFID